MISKNSDTGTNLAFGPEGALLPSAKRFSAMGFNFQKTKLAIAIFVTIATNYFQYVNIYISCMQLTVASICHNILRKTISA